MKCWKCGQELVDASNICVYCGAPLCRPEPITEVGFALRLLYDRYGPQEVLRNPAYIVNGLGDLLEDPKKIKKLFRQALNANLGSLYIDQLSSSGNPDSEFRQRVFLRLTEDSGLSSESASQISVWMDEMIGWVSAGIHNSSRPRSRKIIGIDIGTKVSRVAVIENGKPVVIPAPDGKLERSSAVCVHNGRILLGKEALKKAEVEPDQQVVSYKCRLGSSINTLPSSELFTPELLTALQMRLLCKDADDYLGEHVTEAVVTVPVAFTSRQRQAVIDAGRIAGITVKRLINNSSAAALAYDCQTDSRNLVCNLGAGSFDVSVIEIEDGVIEVLASAGGCELGGNSFDEHIAEHLADIFLGKTGVNLRKNQTAMKRLIAAAEKAKIELSSVSSSHIYVPYIIADSGIVHHLDMMLTRKEFNEITAPLREKAAELIRQVIADSGFGSSLRDKVFLVGEGGRIPALRDLLRQITGKDICQRIDSSFCMAQGAAIMGGILSGDVVDIVLIDVLTASLGIETEGKVCTRLIARNTSIPTRVYQDFSTSSDNQTSIELHVLQGEKTKAESNMSLGKYNLAGIPLAKKGIPRIEVTFDVDPSGLLAIKAVEKGTQKQYMLDSGLPAESIIKQAEQAKEIVPL